MRTLKKSAGFTLLEIMVSVSIIAIVIGILSSMAIGLGDTAQTQSVKGNAGDQVRRGMINIIRDLRQADGVNITGMPGDTITYRVARDMDSNGVAVNSAGTIEYGPWITVGRDVNDLNGDGIFTQLIRSEGNQNDVFANNLLPNEDANHNGVLDAGEDLNNNGQLDRGLWFQRNGQFIEMTIQAGGKNRSGHLLTFNLTEVVRPRN